MKRFMDQDFLLETDTARTLYHDHAAQMPVIDYHCHINPRDIAEDKRYESVTEVWLGADHYKWRLMRAAGVPESEITGALQSDPKTVFRRFAEVLPRAAGNPIYHWSHLELQRYFGVTEPLSGRNADDIYERCNARLREPDMSARGIIRQSNVKLLCTTDDPADDLIWHDRIREDASCSVKVLPAFRPEKAMNIEKPDFADYAKRLGQAAGCEITSFADMAKALRTRVAYFQSKGCRASDHALNRGIYAEATPATLEAIFHKGLAGEPLTAEEGEQYRTAILRVLAEEYTKYGWAMQLHFGCLRDNNAAMFERLGPDTGFDCINGDSRPEPFAALLKALKRDGVLPRVIFYSLNPADNEALMSMAGCFNNDAVCPAQVQVGSAWWFNDHKYGMEKHMADFAAFGLLGGFIGMLTDSRSFLSYTRHEYFRRILCNFLGNLVERGEYPNDPETLGAMVRDISYHNTVRYFGFEV